MLFVPQKADCPIDPALLEAKRLTRYLDGKHTWQELQDDWAGPEAQRHLEFSWLGETVFYKRSTGEVSSSASDDGSDMEKWRETSASNARIPAMPRADAEDEELLLAHRDKIEEQPTNPQWYPVQYATQN